MGQRYFITGANGFLGSHLVDALLDRGDEVSCLVRKTSDLSWLEGKNIRKVYGDVAAQDQSWQDALAGHDIVVHNAGVIKEKNKGDFFRVNTQGTENIIRGCLEKTPQLKRFLFISSIAAHGPSEHPSGMKESDLSGPVSHYGRSKVAAEALVQNTSLPYTVIRPAAIYGPRDYQFLPLLKLSQAGLRLQLGLGKRYINLVHVRDVVAACLLAIDNEASLGEIFHIGGDTNHSWGDLGRTFSQSMGRRTTLPLYVPIVAFHLGGVFSEMKQLLTGKIGLLPWDKVREARQRSWAVDISKAMKLLGYQPKTDLSRGLAETLSWYREQGAL